MGAVEVVAWTRPISLSAAQWGGRARTVREVFLEGLASITLVVCFCCHYDGLKRPAQRDMGILKGSTTARFWAGVQVQRCKQLEEKKEGQGGQPTLLRFVHGSSARDQAVLRSCSSRVDQK